MQGNVQVYLIEVLQEAEKVLLTEKDVTTRFGASLVQALLQELVVEHVLFLDFLSPRHKTLVFLLDSLIDFVNCCGT